MLTWDELDAIAARAKEEDQPIRETYRIQQRSIIVSAHEDRAKLLDYIKWLHEASCWPTWRGDQR
jgi:hypothetical protein